MRAEARKPSPQRSSSVSYALNEKIISRYSLENVLLRHLSQSSESEGDQREKGAHRHCCEVSRRRRPGLRRVWWKESGEYLRSKVSVKRDGALIGTERKVTRAITLYWKGELRRRSNDVLTVLRQASTYNHCREPMQVVLRGRRVRTVFLRMKERSEAWSEKGDMGGV